LGQTDGADEEHAHQQRLQLIVFASAAQGLNLFINVF